MQDFEDWGNTPAPSAPHRVKIETRSLSWQLQDPLLGKDFIAGTTASELILIPIRSVKSLSVNPNLPIEDLALNVYLPRIQLPFQARYSIDGKVHAGWIVNCDDRLLTFHSLSGSQHLVPENLDWLAIRTVDNSQQIS